MGCSEQVSSEGEEETPPVESSVEQHYFTGTIREFVDARAACFERYGLQVTPGNPNDHPYFTVDFSAVGEARFDEVSAHCHEVIGHFEPPTLSEEAAIELYIWLEGQFQCFVDAGFDMEPLLSRELFLDEAARYGHARTVVDPVGHAWESIIDASGNSATYQWDELLALCPRSTEEWPSD